MKILDVIQGSPEWHAVRRVHFCASDAPVIMGASSKMKRRDLLQMMATGNEREISAFLRGLFADGHATEALSRPAAEAIIGQDLYPVTGVLEKMLASFDGLTADGTISYEHKLWNEALAAAVRANDLPAEYAWQLEHQLYVCKAEKVLFMVSDGTPERTEWMWYVSRPERRSQLLLGWDQFGKDLAAYVPEEIKAEVVGREPETLPALQIQLTGMVTASNLAEYKERAIAVIRSINRDLKTDEDFANAEKAVSWCEKVEAKLKETKDAALAQTASIADLFSALDDMAAEARATRLEIDKLVKARKENIRVEILNTAKASYQAHVAELQKALGVQIADCPAPDFIGVMRGKRTISTLQAAADNELTRCKILASQLAEKLAVNLTTLRELAGEHLDLFPDRAQVVQKSHDDLVATIRTRIDDHKARTAQKLEDERAKIRKEEEARAAAKPAAAPAPEPEHNVTPIAKGKPAKAAPAKQEKRPSAWEMISVLADHYLVSDDVIVRWMSEQGIKVNITKEAG